MSITRCLVVYDAIMAWHMIEAGHSISGTQLAMHIMAMSAAFGKSTFSFFLTKWSHASTTTDSTVVTDTTTRTITENRASGDHEATP